MLPQIDLAEKLVKSSFGYPKDVSKFELLSFNEEKPVKIDTGLMQECRANFECKVEKSELIGDHNLLIARVLAIHYDKKLYFSDLIIDLDKATPCIHYRKCLFKNGEKHVFNTGISNKLEIKNEYPILPKDYYDE